MRGFDIVLWVLAAAVVLCALILLPILGLVWWIVISEVLK